MDNLDVASIRREVAAAQRLLASIDDELSTITRECRTKLFTDFCR
jgi:hypothetical protein